MVRLLKHTLILIVLLFVQLHNVKSEEALYSEATIFAQKDKFVVHTIQRGETLFSLQRRYGVEVDSILAANPGLSVKTFYADRKIRIPIDPDAIPVVQEIKTTPVVQETPKDTIKQTEARIEVKKVEQIAQTAIPSVSLEGTKTPERPPALPETNLTTESSPVSKGRVTSVPVATEDTTQREKAKPIVTEEKAKEEKAKPIVNEDTAKEEKTKPETPVVAETKKTSETTIVAETKKAPEQTVVPEKKIETQEKVKTQTQEVAKDNVTKTKVTELSPTTSENTTTTKPITEPVTEPKVEPVAEPKVEPLVVSEDVNYNFPQNQGASIVRFDSDLYKHLSSGHPIDSLVKRHKNFLKIYGEQVIGVGKPDSEEFQKKFNAFFTEPSLMSLFEDEQTRFKTLEGIERELNPAIDALLVEFPMLIRPTVYAHVSGLNQNVIVTDDILSISLDKYMGTNYSFYRKYFYNYQLQNMSPERIVPDYLLGFLMANFPYLGDDDVLLSRMIYEGKLRYVLTRALPHRAIWSCLSYNEVQHLWCTKNHSQIWKTILKSDHLYTPDYMTTAKYFNTASHTATISTESPGGVGVWIGFQIVDSYMKNNPGTTLIQLMNTMNTQQFLKDSKYKP